MSKIDFKEERIPRMQKILDHARATINLFNNIPQVVKYQFKDEAFFIELEALDKKGTPRKLTYTRTQLSSPIIATVPTGSLNTENPATTI